MGNAVGTRRLLGGDEESAVLSSFGEATALGAREALLEAYREEAAKAAVQDQQAAAQVQQAAALPGAGPAAGAGGGAAPAPPMVGGVMSLSHAANAAAEGANDAFMAFLRLLPEAQRRHLTESELRQLQASLAAGAASGVRGAACMAAMYAPAAASPPALLHAPAPALPQAVVADQDAPPPAITQARSLRGTHSTWRGWQRLHFLGYGRPVWIQFVPSQWPHLLIAGRHAYPHYLVHVSEFQRLYALISQQQPTGRSYLSLGEWAYCCSHL